MRFVMKPPCVAVGRRRRKDATLSSNRERASQCPRYIEGLNQSQDAVVQAASKHGGRASLHRKGEGGQCLGELCEVFLGFKPRPVILHADVLMQCSPLVRPIALACYILDTQQHPVQNNEG